MDLKERLTDRLKKQLIPARLVLSSFCFLDERLRENAIYQDSHYIPFFYYLGNELKPRKLAEFGCGIALYSSVCLLGSQGAYKVLLVERDKREYYSARLAKTNIKQLGLNPYICVSNQIPEIYNQDEWDLVLINDDYFLEHLDLIWKKISLNGHLCFMDLNNKSKEISDFCKVKNREAMVIDARYNMYIIRK